MHSMLKTFDAMVSEQMLGNRWVGHPARMQGIACLGHLDTNTHWHIVLTRDPVLIPLVGLEHHDDRIWRKLFPSGNAMTDDVRGIADCAHCNFKAIRDDMFESHVAYLPYRT